MNSVVQVSHIGTTTPAERRSGNTDQTGAVSFREVLDKAQEDRKPIHFSHHASERAKSRGIQLTNQDIDRLEEAVAKARDKGSRNTLILMDGRAFIVGARTGTVVTVAGENDLASNVFTNIDATVLA